MIRGRRSRSSSSAGQPSLPGLGAPQGRTRRLATPHDQALEVARTRLIAGAFVFALAYLVIGTRLVDLSLFHDGYDAHMARPDSGDSVASRADITDRNGVVLATSLPTYLLCADATKISDSASVEKQLLGVLPGLDPQRLAAALASGKHCAVITRDLTPRQYYDVNRLGIIGLDIQQDEHRLYPADDIAAHVIGFTGIDDNGLAGMEEALNSRLEDQQGPVALSIDLRVQTILHNELDKALEKFHAVGGDGLVMDIKTGEILALVSLPDFDPAHPGDATPRALFNRATLGVYEMGSTFKIFNTAMALQSGLIHAGDRFDTVDPVKVGGRTIHDFEHEKRWLNVAEIFTHSSNIGSARMADKLGGDRQRAFLDRLGLLTKIPLELPEVGTPLMPRDWGEATTMTVAFGHGVAVNAVQLAAAAATIVNNGIPVHPTLLKAGDDAAADTNNAQPVISRHVSAMMRGLMRLVVSRGTGADADIAGYLVGGKTGTANEIVNGHYVNDARRSSFLAVFPINAPRYLVFGMLDDPKGDAKTQGFATGGYVVAPAIGRTISQIGPLLDVQPLDPQQEAAAEQKLMRPLGSLTVDGRPVDEGLDYASYESHKGQ
ncbi:MAG TPA: penicillin-binding protein 2 [Alphaproteobacteria bacterium]|nr:penicillin-binding protein 2 [Alphaproteobacteria bacterium]